jgi:hypothetical protein
MLRRTTKACGYEKWPWPAALPIDPAHWFHPLKLTSVAKEVRGVQVKWDMVVVGLLGFFAYRTYANYNSGAYQTRLKHLNNTAPAIIAQDFDFEAGAEGARKVSRQRLDEYRAAFATQKAKREPIESIIFKY